MIQAPPDSDQGLTEGPLTIERVALQLGLSRGKVYELCRTGVMPHDRFGRHIVITTQHLKAYEQANRSPDAGTKYRHLSPATPPA